MTGKVLPEVELQSDKRAELVKDWQVYAIPVGL